LAPEQLKAPFPWFGGKRAVASLVWSRLGNPDNVIEPFFGSGAVLLLRPDPPRVETVNDLDCYVANFWRATSRDSDAVAAHADGPVNECDLHARHRWLVLSDDAAAFRERMRTDPDYHDARIAGWWCWGLCCWIGGGWCAEPGEATNGPAGGSGDRRPAIARARDLGQGVHSGGGLSQKRPLISGGGKKTSNRLGNGVHARGPSDLGQACPQLADAYDLGRGVHASPPALSQAMPKLESHDGLPGGGVHKASGGGTCAQRREWLLDWFGRLRDRLRNVRVCCGDWLRVCDSESVTTRLGATGIFFDPPYGAGAGRAKDLYAQDSLTVADDVRKYCLERGANPMMRICLAGYEGEGHEELERHGWKVESWEAQGGYANRKGGKGGNANARKERLWFSPHCGRQRGLFDGLS
jgi:D12 class N6 adenine-specific DNA methyltransferase